MTLALALIAPVMAQPADEPGTPEPVEAPAPPALPGLPTPPTPPALPTPPRPPAIPDLKDLPGVPDWVGTGDLPGVPPGLLERSKRGPIRTEADLEVELNEPSNDVFAMGQRVSLQAPVSDNAFLMAQVLLVDSPVNGDLFAMGEAIRIDQPVSGDLYAMGAHVEVTPNGSIAGNVKGAAGELILRGPVAGDIDADVGRLVLGAPVAGDVAVDFGEIEVEDGAAIAGDLEYGSPERSPDLEATVAGEVAHTERVVEIEIEEHDHEELEQEASFLSRAVWWTGMRGWGYLTKLLVGVVLLLIGGERIAAIGRRAASHPGQSLGVGFLAACVLPMASFAALVTIVPFPLGLLGFAAFGMLLYVGQIFAAHAFGDLILKRFRPGAVGSPYLSLAVGLVPLIALCAIPWLGNLAWLAATLAGIGALWSVLRGQA